MFDGNLLTLMSLTVAVLLAGIALGSLAFYVLVLPMEVTTR